MIMDCEEKNQTVRQPDNNIELRSEKVRNIIGRMPPYLVRWGNTILIVIFIILLVAAALWWSGA